MFSQEELQRGYSKWVLSKLQSYREHTLEEIESIEINVYWYISGQIEYGTYDRNDIWGNYGYVVCLRLVREIINEKRLERGLEPKKFKEEF